MRRIWLPVLGAISLLTAASAVPGWAQAPQPVPATPPRGTAVPPPALPRPAAPAATPATPARPAPAATTTPAATPAPAVRRIDINSATEAQLDSLPGIGPVRAKAIVAGRPYTDVKELETKKVLTTGVLAGIIDLIALANINTSSAADLQRTLPGIGDVRSKAIVAGRPYATPDDLVAKKVLTQGALDGIKTLITY